MALHLGDIAPNFRAQTTEGEIDFHEYMGGSWGVLFRIQQILHQFVLLNWEKLLFWPANLPGEM
mgnify:CR=1 FL=1